MKSLFFVGAVESAMVIALYGAVLSTGIALAQLAKWILFRRTRIRIEVDIGQGSPWLTGKFAGQPSIVLWIEVINEGERDEQVAWLKVDHLHPDATWLDSGVGEGDIILPRHRKTYVCAEMPAVEEGTDLELDAIEGPCRVRVILGSGEEFLSDIQASPGRRLQQPESKP